MHIDTKNLLEYLILFTFKKVKYAILDNESITIPAIADSIFVICFQRKKLKPIPIQFN